jgi:hypothetical protein
MCRISYIALLVPSYAWTVYAPRWCINLSTYGTTVQVCWTTRTSSRVGGEYPSCGVVTKKAEPIPSQNEQYTKNPMMLMHKDIHKLLTTPAIWKFQTAMVKDLRRRCRKKNDCQTRLRRIDNSNHKERSSLFEGRQELGGIPYGAWYEAKLATLTDYGSSHNASNSQLPDPRVQSTAKGWDGTVSGIRDSI